MIDKPQGDALRDDQAICTVQIRRTLFWLNALVLEGMICCESTELPLTYKIDSLYLVFLLNNVRSCR